MRGATRAANERTNGTPSFGTRTRPSLALERGGPNHGCGRSSSIWFSTSIPTLRAPRRTPHGRPTRMRARCFVCSATPAARPAPLAAHHATAACRWSRRPH